MSVQSLKKTIIFKLISVVVLVGFILSSVVPPRQALAQALNLPQPGTMVTLSPVFTPTQLKGLAIDPQNPFKFDFLIYRGDEKLVDADKQSEYSKLIKYFLAALAVPDNEQWVNLSPYEKDRIIPDAFGKTEMGRDLLAQDYILKQLSSSLTHPATELGKKFWDQVYAEAQDKLGTVEIPTDTFNKIWIMPDKAVIYEKDNTVYVVEHHLKVMMDSDYLAMKNNGVDASLADQNSVTKISSQVMHDVILPAVEKEVNEGRNFAQLRQVYSGMLLAAWYKRALKESILTKVYGDQSRLKGIDQPACRQAGTPCQPNQEIYDQYVTAFKKGAFNMIKEDVDKYTQEVIPRKYFSGGVVSDGAMFNEIVTRASELPAADAAQTDVATVELKAFDAAQVLKKPGMVLPKTQDVLAGYNYTSFVLALTRNSGAGANEFLPASNALSVAGSVDLAQDSLKGLWDGFKSVLQMSAQGLFFGTVLLVTAAGCSSKPAPEVSNPPQQVAELQGVAQAEAAHDKPKVEEIRKNVAERVKAAEAVQAPKKQESVKKEEPPKALPPSKEDKKAEEALDRLILMAADFAKIKISSEKPTGILAAVWGQEFDILEKDALSSGNENPFFVRMSDLAKEIQMYTEKINNFAKDVRDFENNPPKALDENQVQAMLKELNKRLVGVRAEIDAEKFLYNTKLKAIWDKARADLYRQDKAFHEKVDQLKTLAVDDKKRATLQAEINKAIALAIREKEKKAGISLSPVFLQMRAADRAQSSLGQAQAIFKAAAEVPADVKRHDALTLIAALLGGKEKIEDADKLLEATIAQGYDVEAAAMVAQAGLLTNDPVKFAELSAAAKKAGESDDEVAAILLMTALLGAEVSNVSQAADILATIKKENRDVKTTQAMALSVAALGGKAENYQRVHELFSLAAEHTHGLEMTRAVVFIAAQLGGRDSNLIDARDLFNNAFEHSMSMEMAVTIAQAAVLLLKDNAMQTSVEEEIMVVSGPNVFLARNMQLVIDDIWDQLRSLETGNRQVSGPGIEKAFLMSRAPVEFGIKGNEKKVSWEIPEESVEPLQDWLRQVEMFILGDSKVPPVMGEGQALSLRNEKRLFFRDISGFINLAINLPEARETIQNLLDALSESEVQDVDISYDDNDFNILFVKAAFRHSVQSTDSKKMTVARQDVKYFKKWLGVQLAKINEASDAAMVTAIKPVDRAQTSDDFTRGGIDMNAANLDLTIRRDGRGMPLPTSEQNLDNIHIDGLVPVILDIKPAATLAIFNGPNT
ncbi:MAG: hypothetical protein HQL16_05460 [Candidatus Omnitrophica bacterium]|nr:hypothetical protein [Candidatus Omnitrophota bacterium]